MKLKPEELLAAIRTRIGDDLSEEAITLLENATDTLATPPDPTPEVDPESGASYKDKYESLAKRYKERFVSGSEIVAEQAEAMEKDTETNAETITINDLFKEREG